MANIQVITVNETLVVDSRLVAEELGIKHKAFLETIRKYLPEFEGFGVLPFETAKPIEDSQGGRPETFCWLNEEQATYAMTLSRNTDKVRQCKRNLVKAFSEAKKVIKSVIPQQLETIRELELRLQLANAEKDSAIAQKNLLDTRHYITTALPEPIQQKILGYEIVERVEFRDRIISENQLINDGSTISKTALCHRYGILTKAGKPDYKKLNTYLSKLPSQALILSASIQESQQLNRSFLSMLDKVIDRDERQMWLGE